MSSYNTVDSFCLGKRRRARSAGRSTITTTIGTKASLSYNISCRSLRGTIRGKVVARGRVSISLSHLLGTHFRLKIVSRRRLIS